MAIIIVEDGTEVTGSNSYVSVAELDAYVADRGITITATDKTTLLILSMDWIESKLFIGNKITETQGLQWPRENVYIDGFEQATSSIPTLLKEGQLETALAVDGGNSPFSNVPRKISRVSVDTIDITYHDNSSSTVTVRAINLKLQKLLKGGSSFLQPLVVR